MQPQDQVWHSPLGSSNRTQQQQQLPIRQRSFFDNYYPAS